MLEKRRQDLGLDVGGFDTICRTALLDHLNNRERERWTDDVSGVV